MTLLFAGFTLGFFTARSISRAPVTVSVPAQMQTIPAQPETEPSAAEETSPPVTFPININLADKQQFMALPGIGETLADRIVAWREEHGSFSQITDLMMVEGIGEKRMEQILDLVTTGGSK